MGDEDSASHDLDTQGMSEVLYDIPDDASSLIDALELELDHDGDHGNHSNI